MTDHDWEVDRVKGGSAVGRGGTDAGKPEPGVPEPPPANVVPFPGNWFGSVEELIPVHPEPVPPLGPESPATVLEPASPELEADPSSAADASDFWEGDAAALEEVAAPSQARSSIALLRSPGVARRKQPVDSGPARVSVASADTQRLRGRRPAWRLTFVATLTAAVAGTVVLAMNAGMSTGTTRRPGDTAAVTRRHTAEVVTQTITAPVTTVTTTVTTQTHRHGSTEPHPHQASGSATKAGATDAGAESGSTSTGATSVNNSAPPAVLTPGSADPVSDSGCAATSPDSGCRP